MSVATPHPPAPCHRTGPRRKRSEPTVTKLFEAPDRAVPTITLYGSIVAAFPADPKFFQMMLSRLMVGQVRYGRVDSSKDYLPKAQKALRDYERTGNLEFLVDAANYCLLEAHHPLHAQAHLTIKEKGLFHE